MSALFLTLGATTLIYGLTSGFNGITLLGWIITTLVGIKAARA